MGIVGAVMERQAVARALLEQKFLVVRIGLAVDREGVEFARAARHFFKQHVQLLRGRGGRPRLAEDGVVPTGFRRRRPLRRAVLIGVLDDDAQAAFAHRILRRAHDPDAGLIHFHPSIDPLARTQYQNVHRRRSGHGISIQRDHVELVAGQRQMAILNRAGVEKMEHHALPHFHANRLARAQRFVVDGIDVGLHLQPRRRVSITAGLSGCGPVASRSSLSIAWLVKYGSQSRSAR